MPDYLLGIDGGGTSCRAAIASADGIVLGRGRAGSANIMTDPEGAVGNIIKSAEAACLEAGLPTDLLPDLKAFLGLAGNNVSTAVKTVEALLPFKTFVIESDGLIALQGALGEGDGVVAIVGTGSVYLCRRNGVVSTKGGWGFAIGDLGSGARLGHALLQESLLVYDGIHPQSSMVSLLLSEFDNDPTAIVSFAHKALPVDFGRFAPRVFEAAEKGDATAMRLLRQSASHVDAALDAMLAERPCPICLLGGLASHYPQWLAERHAHNLVAPRTDALTGAVELAARQFGSKSGGLAA